MIHFIFLLTLFISSCTHKIVAKDCLLGVNPLVLAGQRINLEDVKYFVCDSLNGLGK